MWLFFDEPQLAQDPRFATAADRRRRSEEIEALLLPHLSRYTMEELFLGLAPLRLLIGMTMIMEGLLADPHLDERGFFERGPGGAAMPGAPFKMSETKWSLRRPAPSLGEHDDEVFGR